jgi:hypothetical protein
MGTEYCVIGSVFGCKMGATCDAVRDVAVTELEGRSSGPGMVWSIWDVGETTDDCTSRRVSLGTGVGEDDNGIAGTNGRSDGNEDCIVLRGDIAR